jgi:hypothetical protein
MPPATSAVPSTAISHRNVPGRVARSMTVFLPTNGRCQSLRKAMYSPRLRRNPEAAAPPKTRTTGWPSRYAAASPFIRSAQRCAWAILGPDCAIMIAIVAM